MGPLRRRLNSSGVRRDGIALGDPPVEGRVTSGPRAATEFGKVLRSIRHASLTVASLRGVTLSAFSSLLVVSTDLPFGHLLIDSARTPKDLNNLTSTRVIRELTVLIDLVSEVIDPLEEKSSVLR